MSLLYPQRRGKTHENPWEVRGNYSPESGKKKTPPVGAFIFSILCIHFGLQEHMLSGHGVGELQTVGAEELAGKTHFAFLGAVLGVAQDGVAHVGAVDPELVGAAGDGAESEFT